MILKVKINGEEKTREIEANASLLAVLRDMGYTSVKFGCGEGECGACSVLLDGKLINSCIMLAARVNGHEITTVEGIGTMDAPHPLQKAFAEAGAVQCGYSTPGSILAAYALLQENPDPSEDDIRQALDGNLCRCTGYVKRIEAVKLAIRMIKESNNE